MLRKMECILKLAQVTWSELFALVYDLKARYREFKVTSSNCKRVNIEECHAINHVVG